MKRYSEFPYEGNEKYIFASYCHADKDKVYPIIEKMATDGYRVWYDEGIHPGTDWPEMIAEHLNGCAVCIAFITENSINSHNCRREINYALIKKKPMISVYLEEITASPGMEMQLALTQSLFRFQYSSTEAFFDKLYQGEVLEPCRKTAEIVQEPDKPKDIITSDEKSGEHNTHHVPLSDINEKDEAFPNTKEAHVESHPKKPVKKSIFALCSGVLGVVLIVATIVMAAHFINNSSTPNHETTAAPTVNPEQDLRVKMDTAILEERTFSVQENFFACIDKNGKAHAFEIDGSYIKETDIYNNRNYDLVAIEYSSKGSGAGFGVRKDGSVILLAPGQGIFRYESALPHLENIVDVVSTTSYSRPFKSDITFAWIVGLRKDGTVANAILYDNDENPRTLHDYDSWTNIKSIAFESGRPFGLKEDGTVISVEDNETTVYKELTDIGSMPQDMLNLINPDVYLRKNGTLVIPTEDNILFSYDWVEASKWTDIVAFSTAFRNIIGLKRDGTVVAVGPNENGQCNVSEWKDIVAIKTTDKVTIGKKSDGTFVIATNNPTLAENFLRTINSETLQK